MCVPHSRLNNIRSSISNNNNIDTKSRAHVSHSDATTSVSSSSSSLSSSSSSSTKKSISALHDADDVSAVAIKRDKLDGDRDDHSRSHFPPIRLPTRYSVSGDDDKKARSASTSTSTSTSSGTSTATGTYVRTLAEAFEGHAYVEEAAAAVVVATTTIAPASAAPTTHKFISCENEAIECVEKCNVKEGTDDYQCLSQCASNAASQYWKGLVPTVTSAKQYCKVECEENHPSESEIVLAECQWFCLRGFSDHFFIGTEDIGMLCSKVNEYEVRDPFPNPPSMTCLDDCFAECKTMHPGTNNAALFVRTECFSMCTHNSASAYYLRAARPAVKAVNAECDDAKCRLRYNERFYPTQTQCKEMRLMLPHNITPFSTHSFCSEWCQSYYWWNEPGVGTTWPGACERGCDAAYNVAKRKGTRADCQTLCDMPWIRSLGSRAAYDGMLKTQSDAESENHGCWMGCLNSERERRYVEADGFGHATTTTAVTTTSVLEVLAKHKQNQNHIA